MFRKKIGIGKTNKFSKFSKIKFKTIKNAFTTHVSLSIQGDVCGYRVIRVACGAADDRLRRPTRS